MKISELNRRQLRDVQYAVEDFIKAVKRHCAIDEDDDYIVLVGNEDNVCDRFFLSEKAVESIDAFLKCDLE